MILSGGSKRRLTSLIKRKLYVEKSSKKVLGVEQVQYFD